MLTGVAGHDIVEARLHIFRKIKLTIFMHKYRGSFLHSRRTQPVVGERHVARYIVMLPPRGDIRNKKALMLSLVTTRYNAEEILNTCQKRLYGDITN